MEIGGLPGGPGRKEPRNRIPGLADRPSHPRDRTLDEIRPHKSSSGTEGRSEPHTCSECSGQFSFPKLVDEGQGDIQLHCPICDAELRRIERELYVAEREQWQVWAERVHRTLREDVNK